MEKKKSNFLPVSIRYLLEFTQICILAPLSIMSIWFNVSTILRPGYIDVCEYFTQILLSLTAQRR